MPTFITKILGQSVLLWLLLSSEALKKKTSLLFTKHPMLYSKNP